MGTITGCYRLSVDCDKWTGTILPWAVICLGLRSSRRLQTCEKGCMFVVLLDENRAKESSHVLLYCQRECSFVFQFGPSRQWWPFFVF